MRYSFHAEQWIPYSINQVFEFFSNPDNLPLLMPSWQKARIDRKLIVPPPPPSSPNSQSSKAAGSGSRVTLSFLPFPFSPFRVRWIAEIAEFKWNERFCDRQLQGPFAYWSHCHYIQATPRAGIDGTLIADDLEYELPMGISGEIAHRLVLRRQIERTFQFRQAQVSRIFPEIKPSADPQPAVSP
jgi:ligand-binding SRPBCC domain-containing protein